MRILFTRFPLESALGGAEIQTLSLMEGLIERGHAIAFAGSCPVLLAECRKRHIPVIELNIGKPPVTKWEAVSFVWRKQSMKSRLEAVFNTFKQLDAIIMLSLSEKLLLTDIAADAGTTVVWVEHDRIGRWLSKNPWLPLLLRQAKKATTVTVSELSRKMYVKMEWDAKRTIAIPNGVMVSLPTGQAGPTNHATLRRAQGDTPLHLGCIARLSREKGVDVLIEAMAQTSDDVTLEIIGTGREASALKKLSASLGLDDRVTFIAREPDIAGAYNRFDVLVLPSRDNDPFGMVAAEAMLAGLAVIVTDQCGITGYLEDGKDALIVRADSSSALADGINRYQMSDIRYQIAGRGQKTALEKFSLETMVNEYEKLCTQKNR